MSSRLTILLAFLASFLAAAFVSSCLGVPNLVETSRVRPAAAYVLARHDGYVSADTGLQESAKLLALGQAQTVRTLLEAPRADTRELAAPLREVLARHDAYVIADRALDPLAISNALAGSDVLRMLIDPPK